MLVHPPAIDASDCCPSATAPHPAAPLKGLHAYAERVTLEEVSRYAESLPQVKRKGTASRPAWYVNNRLLMRLHDPDTLVIRVPLSKRESLLERYPDSFGVPPRMEDTTRSRPTSIEQRQPAVLTAIDLAWEMQHS